MVCRGMGNQWTVTNYHLYMEEMEYEGKYNQVRAPQSTCVGVLGITLTSVIKELTKSQV